MLKKNTRYLLKHIIIIIYAVMMLSAGTIIYEP